MLQETFLKALRMMDRVDDSFNFGGWIHTVARNLCFDELRRRHRLLRVTKGCVKEQPGKLDRSGLRRYFEAVEVVAEKDAESYHAIVEKFALNRRTTWSQARRICCNSTGLKAASCRSHVSTATTFPSRRSGIEARWPTF